MHGKNKIICIAGKNKCAIECLSHVIKKYKNAEILALPNRSDKGTDGWQKSFRKFAIKKRIPIVDLENLYKKKIYIFFSLEYEEILKTKKFVSKNLFNLHFSLLPKYRAVTQIIIKFLMEKKNWSYTSYNR